MKYLMAMIAVSVLGLSACSKQEEKPEENVFQTQTEALDKAKAVEEMFKTQDAETRKQIDEQSQ
jgi:hypothetical protein